MDAPRALTVLLLSPGSRSAETGGEAQEHPDPSDSAALLGAVAPLLASPSVPKILHGSKSLQTKLSMMSSHGLSDSDGKHDSGGAHPRPQSQSPVLLDGVVMDVMVAAHLRGGPCNEVDHEDLALHLGHIVLDDLMCMMMKGEMKMKGQKAKAFTSALSGRKSQGRTDSAAAGLLQGQQQVGSAVAVGDDDDDDRCILQSAQLWMMGRGLQFDLQAGNARDLFQVWTFVPAIGFKVLNPYSCISSSRDLTTTSPGRMWSFPSRGS